MDTLPHSSEDDTTQQTSSSDSESDGIVIYVYSNS